MGRGSARWVSRYSSNVLHHLTLGMPNREHGPWLDLRSVTQRPCTDFPGITDGMQQVASEVDMCWGVKIPTRAGLSLHGTLYVPRRQERPSPAVFTLTPYVSQFFHDRGMYFAAHGYPFIAVDARGRGNSEGSEFRPFAFEGRDGADVVDWLVQQPYCDGQVAMWGGSYGGYDQWATAKEHPRSLVTIVPVSAIGVGVDFPMRNNISYPYAMQWLTLVSGRTLQDKLWNESYWRSKFRQCFDLGTPFKALDSAVGNPSNIFQEWISHPCRDKYWGGFNLSPEDYSKIAIPILTITGSYDNAQTGALTYYRDHMKYGPEGARSGHYLVIGPWDHAGTRTPQRAFGGLRFGEASLIDLQKLHLEWYEWIMRDGSRPNFLKRQVAYYVMGAEYWRYADSLEGITSQVRNLYLHSSANASTVYCSGRLIDGLGPDAQDEYVYDPSDLSISEFESTTTDPLCLRPQFLTDSITDQAFIFAREGRQLIYHSPPFAVDTEISGFFRARLWMSIDQPDTDFRVSIYEIGVDGGSILLTVDVMRARYRESLHEEKLINDTGPLLYDFRNFTFISRLVRRGERLRLLIGPIDSIYTQKNYNSGAPVSSESRETGRPVRVRVFHGHTHPSVLIVPIGTEDSSLRTGGCLERACAPELGRC